MLYLLEEYLESITQPETVRIILESCHLLSNAGIHSHEVDIEAILSTCDDFEPEMNLKDIMALLIEYLDSTITEYGISLDEELYIEPLNRVLDTLLILPFYGDSGLVLSTLEEDINNEDKFSQLIALITHREWSEFAILIKRVNYSLIEAIQKRAMSLLPDDQPLEDVTPYRERYMRFTRQFGSHLGQRALNEGVRLKTPYSLFIDRYEESLYTLSANPKALSLNLIGLLMISDVKDSDFTTVLNTLIEHYAKDINTITKTHFYNEQHLKGF